MAEIKVGDIVYVYNWGAKFPVHEAWFIEQLEHNRENFDICWAIRFAYGITGEVSSRNVKYKILYLDGDRALITALYGVNNPVYLIGTDALSKRRRMTKEEIEEELGYEIEIIRG